MTGKTNSSRLNLAHLMSHGLKMAPRGVLNLSYKDNVERKKYTEETFNNIKIKDITLSYKYVH